MSQFKFIFLLTFHPFPRVTPGTWKEGGTIFASMCMFQKANIEKCFTVTTDQHDMNLMHRQAGYRDVLWENALLVPCQIPEGSKNATWYLKVSLRKKTLIKKYPSTNHRSLLSIQVTDHANFGLNRRWINTTK
jgi:hypothetical protein